MKKYSKIVVTVAVAAALAVGVTAVAATPAYTDQDNTFTSIVNWFKKGITIGEQGSGGVTFYNGTIVNNTTDDDGNENPVTFGDKVRIDDTIFRMEEGGSYPVRFGDTVVPAVGSTYSLGSSSFGWNNLYLNGMATQDLADPGLMKAAVSVTAAGTTPARSVENVNDQTADVSITHVNNSGEYEVDFNFDVSDRYISITPHDNSDAAVHCIVDYSVSTDTVTVHTYDVAATPMALTDNGFDIIVF